MKIHLMFDSKSDFLPKCAIPIFKTNFDDYQSLTQLVLDKEQEILSNNKPFPENDDYDWLTNRLYSYNLFDYNTPVMNKFKKFIKQSYIEYCESLDITPKKIFATCWANVVRNNRTITPHDHADAHINAPLEYSYVSGNICLQAKNTNTYYASPYLSKQAVKISNFDGETILFPSWVKHWTDENKDINPRVSVAFDIVSEEVYNLPDSLNSNFREL